MKRHPLYSALCLILLSTLPAHAERVWDSELKRFLTDQELTHAEVFLTEDEALRIMLPKSERIRQDVIRLTPEKKNQIEERIGWKFPEQAFEVYIGETGAQATMSVRSMSAGIKRVLVLVDEFYLKPAGRGSDTVTARKAEKGFFGSLFGN
jgi:hypothetical protein